MPTRRYVLTLTQAERDRLDALTRAGKRSARTITRARILLLADQAEGGPAWEDRRVSEALGAGIGRSNGSGMSPRAGALKPVNLTAAGPRG